MSNLGSKGDVTYYSKPGEKYTIGKVTIGKIIYGFYKDQLFGVYVNIDSAEIYEQLLSHLDSVFGLPSHKANAGSLFVSVWKQDDIKIKLKFDEPKNKMKLAFYYEPISSQLNIKQKEDFDTSKFRFVPIEKDKKPESFVLFEF